MASYYKKGVLTRDFDEKKAKVAAAAKQLEAAKSEKTPVPTAKKETAKKA